MTIQATTPTPRTHCGPTHEFTSRWHAMQAQLSRTVATDASAWAQRSAVMCKWRALPASVLAPTDF
jgi:hypothetical protein